MTATCTRTKAAIIRRPGYPIGQTAPVYLNCSCGKEVDVAPTGPIVCHTCGTTYDGRGWVTGKVEGPPIHNGIRGQWNYLEVVDRASGEVEKIRLDDGNSVASVYSAADFNHMTESQAWDVLLSGGTLATFGFVRRLSK